MSRKLLTYIVITIILVQRVVILQISEIGNFVYISVIWQVLFIAYILYIKRLRKFENNLGVRIFPLVIFAIGFAAIYIGGMYYFLRPTCFDLCLITFVQVFIPNYEIATYKGYETYSVDWKKRLFITLPLAIGVLVVSMIIRNYFFANPVYHTDLVFYNHQYHNIFRNVGTNYHLAIRFVLWYVVYKIDFQFCLIPANPKTTKYWLKYDVDKNYLES